MSMVRSAGALLAVSLIVVVVACGGGGGGGGSSTPPTVVGSKIFVGDNGHGAIGSSPNSNPSAGAVLVDRIITGGSTFLTSGALAIRDFALDAPNDRLFVSDSNRILVFDNVSTASGNVTPRVLATATGGDTFNGVYLDAGNNRLYATVRLGASGNEVRVYNSASSATNASAARAFSFTCDFIFDVAVDTARDIAYVYYVTGGQVHIGAFDQQSLLATSGLTPDRTIDFFSSPGSIAPIGMFLDASHDRLYVPMFGTVEVFDAVSAASGQASAITHRTVTLVGVANFSNVFVELGADRLYAADPVGLTIAPNASTTVTTNGGVRVLVPAGAQFTAVAVKP